MIALGAKWAKLLASQPETGMGYQICTIELQDGQKFEHVMIVGGLITEVGSNPVIPFTESEIQTIVVTHSK
jgi:hypothetical protein